MSDLWVLHMNLVIDDAVLVLSPLVRTKTPRRHGPASLRPPIFAEIRGNSVGEMRVPESQYNKGDERTTVFEGSDDGLDTAVKCASPRDQTKQQSAPASGSTRNTEDTPRGELSRNAQKGRRQRRIRKLLDNNRYSGIGSFV